MGYVLGARDESTAARERVALKLLLPEHSMNRTTVARFLREMRASHRILSEHVARVLNAGDDGGTLYIAMEYLEGSDLAALLEREGSFTVPRAVDTILQACEALAEAHAAGTIHRDLPCCNRRSAGAASSETLACPPTVRSASFSRRYSSCSSPLRCC